MKNFYSVSKPREFGICYCNATLFLQASGNKIQQLASVEKPLNANVTKLRYSPTMREKQI